jgi:hypothetical protein
MEIKRSNSGIFEKVEILSVEQSPDYKQEMAKADEEFLKIARQWEHADDKTKKRLESKFLALEKKVSEKIKPSLNKKDAILFSQSPGMMIEDRILFFKSAAKQILHSKALPASSALQVNDARDVLFAAARLESLIRGSNAHEAAQVACMMGEIGTRMLVRPSEEPAITGRKVRRKNAESRDSKAFNDFKDRKREERAQWLRCAQGYRRRHPLCPKNEIYNHVEKEFSVKLATVKKQLQKEKTLQKVGKS